MGNQKAEKGPQTYASCRKHTHTQTDTQHKEELLVILTSAGALRLLKA
jgi:hypothetical protein